MISCRQIAYTALATGLACSTLPIQASSFKSLYSFETGPYPVLPSGLTLNKGILYGTTYQGGIASDGAIFAFNPKTASLKTLYNFNGSGTGLYPNASLIDIAGTLYGTAEYGGDSGTGTVFAFGVAASTMNVLHSFPHNIGLGNTDGAYSESPLTYLKGTLFGMTTYGGTANQGVIFKVDTATGAEAVLYDFAGGSDGAVPVGNLVYSGGYFYGVTISGGASYLGTVFRFNPSTRTERVLHSFTGGGDGAGPAGALIVYNGSLYGTTIQGGTQGYGTIFRIDLSNGQETVLHSFDGDIEGAYPSAGLTAYNGLLYGANPQGGPNNLGTLFSVDPASGAVQTLYSFSGTDGALPASGLTLSGKVFYGTTIAGGANAQGTVFRFVP